MNVILTRDVMQLEGLPAPSGVVWRWLLSHGATLAQTNNGSLDRQSKPDYYQCGRSWKWSYRGRYIMRTVSCRVCML